MSHNLISSYGGAAGLAEGEAGRVVYPDTCEPFGRVSQDILPGKVRKHGWERSRTSGGRREALQEVHQLFTWQQGWAASGNKGPSWLQYDFPFISSLGMRQGRGHAKANPTVS